MAYSEEYIRAFDGQIIGVIRTEANGDKTAFDFPGKRIVGYYKKRYNYTTNFFGVVVAKGDTVVNLIYENRQ